jgi:DNA-binding MarR family transcriptional regulator
VTDPEDGRAQVVTLSADGKALLATLTSLRTDWFLTMLEDWSTQEARDFQHHILRFTAALEASRARATARATTRPDGDPAGIPSLESS